MKKIKLFVFIFSVGTIAFLTSCGNSTKENSSSEKKDTLFVLDSKLQKTATLFKSATLPFTVDTSFLFHLEKGDSLGTFDIQTLTQNIFKHSLTDGLDYDLKTFYKIDSIKAAGKYKQYCDSLDIGMTKISKAFALNEIQLDANTLILVWGLQTSSYEACPSSASWSAYFTIINKGNVGETFLLGEYSVFADAPVSAERTVSGKLLADGTFSITITQINDQDPDSARVEVSREQRFFAIKDGAIKTLSEKIDAAVNEKRKAR